jgi:feruloyl esterase
MSKAIAQTYYGMKPNRNYWDGCSTGGRQGFALAQNYPEELDGWLVGAPGVNYARFRLAQIWGQLAMKDLAGETPIPLAKLRQATADAVKFCDDNDGIHDSLLSDPRTCKFSATADICGAPNAPLTNCLTAAEAAAIDKIWDGPRNAYGLKIFPGLPIGADPSGLNGAIPQQTATEQIRWEHQDETFDWHTLTMAGYPYEAELGSANPIYQGESAGDIENTMSVALEPVRNGGKKILMWNGTADGSITTHNAMEYYKTVAVHFGNGTPDFDVLQPWFRYFQAPGVGHCGGGDGPQPNQGGMFETMVDWVENGVAPNTITATGGNYYGTPVPSRTRPLCPFPQTAVYNGSGDPNVASSFHCGGNVETKDTICWSLITPYKSEAENDLQAYGKYDLATSKDQCKGGGWQSLFRADCTAFKNQGDCIQYVNTGK